MDLPGLPVDFQAEAAYKWSFVLQQRGFAGGDRGGYGIQQSTAVGPGKCGTLGQWWALLGVRSLLDLGELLEAGGDAEEARRVYRKLVAYNLPGQNLAQSRADRIRISEE